MALENLVDGMSGLQMANTIKNNFDKVLDAESAENKAENAGKSIKTDYDATRYIELQLADGTPVKMKMDVFCQAIAPVVAGLLPINQPPLNPVTDMNEVHLTCRQGLTMLYVIAGTQNKPDGISGIYFHAQRLDNNVSSSQLLYQFSISESKIYLRTGMGNGSGISWREWRII